MKFLTLKFLRSKLLPVALAALLAAVMAPQSWFGAPAALSQDLLYLARHHLPIPAASRDGDDPEESAVAVVAIDEATYQRPPLAGTPKVFWTRELALLIRALLKAEATVIGLDLILPTSVEPYLPGFERPFLLALREAASRGRLLLGKAQHSQRPVAPTPTQSFAVGHQQNVRALNLSMDGDGIIRRHPLFFQAAEGGVEHSMALELTLRAGGLELGKEADNGRITLGGRVVAASEQGEFILNYASGREIPTYSLADILACIGEEREAELERAFAGKVVLIGTVLDLEDRWSPATRLVGTMHGGGVPTGCAPDFPSPAADEMRRESMAGVFFHAIAVDNLLFGEELRELPPWGLALAAAMAASVVAAATMFCHPLTAAGTLVAVSALLLLGGLLLLAANIIFPFLIPVLESGAVFIGLLAYRFALVDRQKMRIRRLFSLYTSPKLIEKMLADDRLPELGGEERQVTVWFSDLAGFTALAEGLRPGEVVALMNRYLTAITEVVEEHGGFVDKYIGDAVLAIFGAPHADPEHPLQAVATALAVQQRLAELAGSPQFMGRTMITRIGINSGPAMVGNIGSPRRFNYTVIGDAVNLASRLEGANKYLGSTILISEQTAALLPPEVLLREVETIRVKGRQTPLRVFEPLALERSSISPERQQQLAKYAEALKQSRSGQLKEAAKTLKPIISQDPLAAAFSRHLAKIQALPEDQRQSVHDLLDK